MNVWWQEHLEISKVRTDYDVTGESIKIAILDTGMDATHPDLSRVTKFYKDFVVPTGDIRDLNGHGTAMAGIIGANGNFTGIAPGASLYIGRVMSQSSFLIEDNLCKGLRWAVQQEVDLICICGTINFSFPPLRAIIKTAWKKNIIVIGAIGNAHKEGHDAGGYPARYDQCISVGAIDKNHKITDFTNKNPGLDILGPGKDIFSTSLKSRYSADWGTSHATAIVTGVIALTLEYLRKNNINYTPDSIREILRESGKIVRYRNFSFKSLHPQALFEQITKIRKV